MSRQKAKSEEEWGELLEGLTPETPGATPHEEPVFPDPKPSKLGLTESARKALDASRTARAMQEAFDVGQGLFTRAPEFIQKQAVDLILIMNSISAAHPRARKKIVGRMIEGCLSAASVWLRDRGKIPEASKKGVT
jgi:hypothetical protein